MGNTRLEFLVPARGLIGFRSEFMTQTKGTGILHHNFHGYEPYKEISVRGRAVRLLRWKTACRSLTDVEAAGKKHVLYRTGSSRVCGMIVGENSREYDMVVNVCKSKQLTNMRASGSDEAVRLEPREFLRSNRRRNGSPTTAC